MRVLVAGASGAIGTRLVPRLLERGHEVIGTFKSPASAERVAALGAEPLVLDLLDPRAVRTVVLKAEPDAIVHQATALADVRFSRSLDRSFAQTNRLRTEGTDALLAAAHEAGVRRFVAQRFANFRYAREGGPVKGEDDPLDPTPVRGMRETSAAMAYLDETVVAAGGIALRYGAFYGAANDGLVEPVRERRFPIVGSGGGVSSSTSTTRPRRPSSRSSTTGRPSTTSSTTSPPRSASGCRCSRRRSAPSRRVIFRAGSRGCSQAKGRS